MYQYIGNPKKRISRVVFQLMFLSRYFLAARVLVHSYTLEVSQIGHLWYFGRFSLSYILYKKIPPLSFDFAQGRSG